MAVARSQRDWTVLIGEYNICKKKLESKREALKIMKLEWQRVQKERDIYKNKINQLQQDLDQYVIKEKSTAVKKAEKQRVATPAKQPKIEARNSCELLYINETSKEALVQLVFQYKEINKALRKDFLELKKLYVESQEDVQILRDRLRKNSTSCSCGMAVVENCVTQDKEQLISQLEEYKGQVGNLEQELKSVRDENSDVLIEKKHYKEKCERLNVQLNYILGADDQRLVDIDALVLDNKYLKEKLQQLEEERNIEKESIQKYEAAFEKKKDALLFRGNIGDRMFNYHSRSNNERRSSKTIEDLRNVANVLSETITEKNLALTHQRNANRILGKRVNELEKKLKTLEVAGLWSLQGHRGYGSIGLDTEDPETASHGQESGTTLEKLEWDDSSSLLELAELERNKILEDTVFGSDDDTFVEESPGKSAHSPIGLDQSTHKDCCQGNKANGALNISSDSIFLSTTPLRKSSRVLSAPTLLGDSFDENDNVENGEKTEKDFEHDSEKN